MAIGHLVHPIEGVVAADDGAGKIDIFPDKSVDAVLEHRHGMGMDRSDDFRFRERRMLIQFAGAAGNVRRLVAHPLYVW